MNVARGCTDLAETHPDRPHYSDRVIDQLLRTAALRPGAHVRDLGAGTLQLNRMLAARGLIVTASSESSLRADEAYRLAIVGPSLPAGDRAATLTETARSLAPGGWIAFLCHLRDRDDPLQAAIESAVRLHLPAYPGTQGDDPTAVIDASGLFDAVEAFQGSVIHEQAVADCLEAWRTHTSLERLAGTAFAAVVRDIRHVLDKAGSPTIEVPYITRCWMAQRR